MSGYEIMSAGLAGVAFILSGIAFYLTQIAKSKISIIEGPRIDVYYTKAGGAGFYIPLTFINSSNNTGTVIRIAMSIANRKNLEQNYYMEWDLFAKYNFDEKINSWESENIVTPVIVQGKSSTQKIVRFIWSLSLTEFIFCEGSYEINFFYWTMNNDKPDKFSKSEIIITKKIAETLNNYKSSESGKVYILQLVHQYTTNKIITKDDVSRLA